MLPNIERKKSKEKKKSKLERKREGFAKVEQHLGYTDLACSAFRGPVSK